ncbi:MAG: SRPBCC domain-containing protein [Pyrinomonadaceae bacterium]|nr:SRPBCC domain-containing protein [Pyrinomonadaceae bacterium]
MTIPAQQTKEIVITREFDAPRELVWKAWTEPEHIEKWFGPKGFSTRVAEHDLSVGGRSTYVMTGPDGKEYPGTGVFLEIVPMERIVSSDEFGEGFEKIMPETELPSGMIFTVQFDDLGGRTRLTLTVSHPTVEDRIKHEKMGVVDGWGTTLDRMDDYLEELKGKTV